MLQLMGQQNKILEINGKGKPKVIWTEEMVESKICILMRSFKKTKTGEGVYQTSSHCIPYSHSND